MTDTINVFSAQFDSERIRLFPDSGGHTLPALAKHARYESATGRNSRTREEMNAPCPFMNTKLSVIAARENLTQ